MVTAKNQGARLGQTYGVRPTSVEVLHLCNLVLVTCEHEGVLAVGGDTRTVISEDVTIDYPRWRHGLVVSGTAVSASFSSVEAAASGHGTRWHITQGSWKYRGSLFIPRLLALSSTTGPFSPSTSRLPRLAPSLAMENPHGRLRVFPSPLRFPVRPLFLLKLTCLPVK